MIGKNASVFRKKWKRRVKDGKLTIFFPRPVRARNNAVRDTPDELEHSNKVAERKRGWGIQ
jgi:hypothetical protein